MDETKRDALKKMLDDYELKQQQQTRQRDERRTALETFLAGYAEVTQSIIKPGFEAFSAELEKRGHPCTIVLEKPTGPLDGLTAAKITLTIFPNSATLTHGNPSLSYAASPNQRKIAAQRNTIMSSGGITTSSVGDYTLEQLSREVVEQHLFDLAASIFGQ
jgi:hypothetical protein